MALAFFDAIPWPLKLYNHVSLRKLFLVGVVRPGRFQCENGTNTPQKLFRRVWMCSSPNKRCARCRKSPSFQLGNCVCLLPLSATFLQEEGGCVLSGYCCHRKKKIKKIFFFSFLAQENSSEGSLVTLSLYTIVTRDCVSNSSSWFWWMSASLLIRCVNPMEFRRQGLLKSIINLDDYGNYQVFVVILYGI